MGCLASGLLSLIEKRQNYLGLLKFESMDARRADIDLAHSQTCQWLFGSPQYKNWLKPKKHGEYHGFLWLRGNPGTGKSTITKFASSNKNVMYGIVIATFFSARGEALQKITEGMHRSLLFQLLEKLPDLQCVLNHLPTISADARPRLSVSTSKELFSYAMEKLSGQLLTCFIDAQDECDDAQVRDMVRLFENLVESTNAANTRLRIWFSSRHYPYISIERKILLVLEDEDGHDQDLASYLRNELKIGSSKAALEIKQEMIRRASGMFLWVVLVVQILIVEYDRGETHALRRRLDYTPDDLHKLFNEILTRDNQTGLELVLCLQWVLYARVPLQLKELYFAVRIGIEPDSGSARGPEGITEDDMERYILNCSKGLTKSTKAERKTVQFIHESVRDFFLKSSKLHISCFGLTNPFTARSHDHLWRCCQEYHNKFYLDQLTSSLGSLGVVAGAGVGLSPSVRKENVSWWPFLEYVVHDALYHIEAAVTSGNSPKTALEDLRLEEWIVVNNLSAYRQYPKNTGLLCILADKNSLRLLQVEVNRQMTSSTDIDQILWYYAAGFGDDSALKLLLARDDIDINTVDNQLKTPLHWAVLNRQHNVANVTFLLNTGKIVLNVQDRQGRTPLTLAADAGQHLIVELLLTYSEIDADTSDIRGMTPLWLAAETGASAVVDVLLKSRRVNLNVLDREGHNLFSIALQYLGKRSSVAAAQRHRFQLMFLEEQNKTWLYMPSEIPTSLEHS